MKDISEIRAYVHAYRDFRECIVRDVRWLAFGTRIEVDVDYVWGDDGKVRGSWEKRRIITLAFCQVQDLHIMNSLTPAMIRSPSRLNWGFAEIARLTVEDQTAKATEPLSMALHRACFWWEKGPWIELSFYEVFATEREESAIAYEDQN